MTGEVRAIIGDAALAAMHEGNRALKSNRRENRAERLASLRRIDVRASRAKFFSAIFLGLGPFAHPLKFGVGDRIFSKFFFLFSNISLYSGWRNRLKWSRTLSASLWHVDSPCRSASRPRFRVGAGVLLI